MKIKDVEINGNLFLAPMAGVTDIAFRTLCKELGASLTYTEMVSVKGLYYNSKNTLKMLETSPIEKPVAVQLFGHEPEIFENVLKSGVLDKFDIIDINMGCPAPKIVNNGDGSSLMKDFKLASEIIKACVRSTQKPVTVKFRKGYNIEDDFLIDFAKMCEESGASAITIHPRTRNQMFSGNINLEDIKKVKEAVNIPVIGNGDIVDKCTYEQMLKTNCDAVMIGRKALECPQIFSLLQGKKVGKNFYQIIKRHIELLKQYFDKSIIVKIFKGYIVRYLGNFKDAINLKQEIVRLDDFELMEQKVDEFFKNKNLEEL